jgi:hypothetical protein
LTPKRSQRLAAAVVYIQSRAFWPTFEHSPSHPVELTSSPFSFHTGFFIMLSVHISVFLGLFSSLALVAAIPAGTNTFDSAPSGNTTGKSHNRFI